MRHPGSVRVEGTLDTLQFERDRGHTLPTGLVRREHGAMMRREG